MKVIAAFDFDGTVTTRDSLLPFLIKNFGLVNVIFKSLSISTKLLGFCFGWTTRQKAKEALLTCFLKGMKKSDLNNRAVEFANNDLPCYVKKEAVDKINWHKAQGHTIALVSASIENYLIPWAASYGFDCVLSSKLEIDDEQKVTGRLIGENCWGKEKVRRLEEFFGKKVEDGHPRYTLYAYGDSRGDLELLAYADYPFFRKWE